MNKKKIMLLVGLTILGMLILGGRVQAATATSMINDVIINWKYDIITGSQSEINGKITGFVCTNPEDLEGEITLPSEMGGYEIYSIGNNAFEGATGITEVTIPSTIKSISEKAFKGCTSLEKIDLGEVGSIGYEVFEDCTSLTKVTIPQSLKNVDSYKPTELKHVNVFKGCTNLTEIVLENGLTTIPSCLLRETNIKNITIPKTVTTINFSAFQDCTELEEIKIPESVKIIGEDAFNGCLSLKTVDLGKIEEIDYCAFRNCTALTSIVIPSTLKSTDTYEAVSMKDYPIFPNCENLINITIENGGKIIPSYLLASTKIEEFTVPESVETIDKYAFADCTELKKITILDNVKKIEKNVFANHDEELTIYCYEGSAIDTYAKDNDIKVKYLTREKAPETEQKKDEGNKVGDTTPAVEDTTKKDTVDVTVTDKSALPKTGTSIIIIVSIVAVAGVSVIMYIKLKKYKEIK